MILDSPAASPPATLVATERLLWVGPLTVLTSVVAVHVVRVAGRTMVPLAEGTPMRVSLGWAAPTADTVILCGLAVAVFAIVGSFSDNPLRTFQQVALGALLVSLLPIVIMAPRGLNGSVGAALTLAAMHVAAYLPCVTLMPWLASIRPRTTS